MNRPCILLIGIVAALLVLPETATAQPKPITVRAPALTLSPTATQSQTSTVRAPAPTTSSSTTQTQATQQTELVRTSSGGTTESGTISSTLPSVKTCATGAEGDCAASCGNGRVETGEACDSGAGSTNPCPDSPDDCAASTDICAEAVIEGSADKCSAKCVVKPRTAAAVICREAAGACDVPEYCDGAGTRCPADAFKARGELCRAADSTNPCDDPEHCLGTGSECPADQKLTSYVFPTKEMTVETKDLPTESTTTTAPQTGTPSSSGIQDLPTDTTETTAIQTRALSSSGVQNLPTDTTETTAIQTRALSSSGVQNLPTDTTETTAIQTRALSSDSTKEQPTDSTATVASQTGTLSSYSVYNVEKFSASTTPQIETTAHPASSDASSVAQAIATVENLCTKRSCNAEGVYSVTSPICKPGDGICCEGCGVAEDSDCNACGNGRLEPDKGETCDPGISPPTTAKLTETERRRLGICPAGEKECDDGIADTIDSLVHPGTCQTECRHVRDDTRCSIAGKLIDNGEVNTANLCEVCDVASKRDGWSRKADGTAVCSPPTSACFTPDTCLDGKIVPSAYVPAKDGDGCCNPADGEKDADCALCGNGTIDGKELCDTKIADGPGACPKSCVDDGDPCTIDELKNPGTCNAFCDRKRTGCTIGGKCFADGRPKSDNPCLICDITANPKGWSAAVDGIACGDANDKCAGFACVDGNCQKKPKNECKPDDCHKGNGVCDPQDGSCHYEDTATSCKAAPAACGDGKREGNEYCDGAVGCGPDQDCVDCKSCKDRPPTLKTEDAAQPAASPGKRLAHVYCRDSSPEVEKANQDLLAKTGGADNIVFCNAETAVVCVLYDGVPAVASSGAAKGQTIAAPAASLRITQERGRSLALMPGQPARAIAQPQALAELTFAPPPATANLSESASASEAPVTQASFTVSSALPGAAIGELKKDSWFINSNITIDRILLNGPETEIQLSLGKQPMKIKAANLSAAASTSIREVIATCFGLPQMPLVTQAEGYEGGNYDMERVIQLVGEKWTAASGSASKAMATKTAQLEIADAIAASGAWTKDDIYNFSFAESGGAAAMIDVAVAQANALESQDPVSVTPLAYWPSYGRGEEGGCTLAASIERIGLAGVLFLIVALILPAGALGMVRIARRRQK